MRVPIGWVRLARLVPHYGVRVWTQPSSSPVADRACSVPRLAASCYTQIKLLRSKSV